MDVRVNLVAKANGAQANVCTARSIGAGGTSSSAICKTFVGHAVLGTFVKYLVVIGFLEADNNLALPSYPLFFQFGEKKEIPLTPG